MDQISTLEVERDQRWSDLVQPTTLALMLLVSDRPDEKGGSTWLRITKAQKQSLLDWCFEHFPEFKNGTPREMVGPGQEDRGVVRRIPEWSQGIGRSRGEIMKTSE